MNYLCGLTAIKTKPLKYVICVVRKHTTTKIVSGLGLALTERGDAVRKELAASLPSMTELYST